MSQYQTHLELISPRKMLQFDTLVAKIGLKVGAQNIFKHKLGDFTCKKYRRVHREFLFYTSLVLKGH